MNAPYAKGAGDSLSPAIEEWDGQYEEDLGSGLGDRKEEPPGPGKAGAARIPEEHLTVGQGSEHQEEPDEGLGRPDTAHLLKPAQAGGSLGAGLFP